MKTLDGTLYRRALDCSGPQSAHTRVVSRAGGQSPLWVKLRSGDAFAESPFGPCITDIDRLPAIIALNVTWLVLFRLANRGLSP